MRDPTSRPVRYLNLIRPRRAETLFALAAALLAVLAAVLALRLWDASPGIPLSYSGDARLYAVVVAETLDDGWHLENDRLGAPFGQTLHDYPFENASLADIATVGVIGLLGGGPFGTMNAFFLLSFAVVALAAFAVLRRLRLSRPAALVCAVLFSLLPYHFYRGEAHLFLSAYYAVPFGALLILRVLAGHTLVGPRRTAATLAVCVLVGTGGIYYAGFTVMLLVAATAVAALGRRGVEALRQGLVPAAAIALVVFCQLLPSFVHRLTHGGTSIAERQPVESELFSLKLADLVFPLESHRLDFLADFTRRYRFETPLTSESGATLGLLATVGFAFLLAAALAATLGAVRLRPRRPLVRAASVATLLGLAIATTGGLATVFAYLVTPQLRVWSRLSVVLAFFALFALGVGIDRLRALLRARGRPPALAGVVLALLLGVGLVEQTSDAFVPDYRGTRVEFESDRGFVRAIERRLPRGAAVYQLPHLQFPEASELVPRGMVIYDPLAGYLHSRDLRWTSGAIKGSPADWARELSRRPFQRALPGLVAAGLAGIEVDRFGYEDRGTAVEAELRRILGVRRALESADGRRAFYDLRPFSTTVRERLPEGLLAELRTAVLRPPRVEWGSDFHGEEGAGPSTFRWSRRPASVLRLRNPAATRRVVFRARVATAGLPARVRLTFPDGRAVRVAAGFEGVPITRTFLLPPGSSRIRLHTAAASAPPAAADRRRGFYVQVLEADLEPAALIRAERLMRAR